MVVEFPATEVVTAPRVASILKVPVLATMVEASETIWAVMGSVTMLVRWEATVVAMNQLITGIPAAFLRMAVVVKAALRHLGTAMAVLVVMKSTIWPRFIIITQSTRSSCTKMLQ